MTDYMLSIEDTLATFTRQIRRLKLEREELMDERAHYQERAFKAEIRVWELGDHSEIPCGYYLSPAAQEELKQLFGTRDVPEDR